MLIRTSVIFFILFLNIQMAHGQKDSSRHDLSIGIMAIFGKPFVQQTGAMSCKNASRALIGGVEFQKKNFSITFTGTTFNYELADSSKSELMLSYNDTLSITAWRLGFGYELVIKPRISLHTNLYLAYLSHAKYDRFLPGYMNIRAPYVTWGTNVGVYYDVVDRSRNKNLIIQTGFSYDVMFNSFSNISTEPGQIGMPGLGLRIRGGA